MVSIKYLSASNGSGEAVKATVSAARSTGATTLQVDSISNFPEFFIATSGVVSGETGYFDPATMKVFLGHTSSPNIIIDSFAPGYTDAGNSVGDVVVLKPTTEWVNQLVDGFKVLHDDDGTFNSTAVTDMKTGLSADTNFRLTPRQSAIASTATLTPNIDNYNIYDITAQTAAIAIANPTGTPKNGDVIVIRIKDDGTGRAITYGTAYENISGLDSITTTVASKTSVIGAIYNAATSKWQIVSLSTGV